MRKVLTGCNIAALTIIGICIIGYAFATGEASPDYFRTAGIIAFCSLIFTRNVSGALSARNFRGGKYDAIDQQIFISSAVMGGLLSILCGCSFLVLADLLRPEVATVLISGLSLMFLTAVGIHLFVLFPRRDKANDQRFRECLKERYE